MERNLRMTGAVAASDAARVLGDPNATGAERSAAASALAQAAHQARQTRAQAASDAAIGAGRPDRHQHQHRRTLVPVGQARLGRLRRPAHI